MGKPHAQGALMGLAVGDALGTTLEFRRDLSPPPFPMLATGPHREIVGGGPWGLEPGQGTDDTAMACLLAESLRDRDLFTGPAAVRYVEWLMAFPPDVGLQTRLALELVHEGLAPAEAGRRIWLESGREAAGNGSLMRTAPIGVCFAEDDAARRAATLDDSAVTHVDPRCQLACIALNAAIAECVRAPGASRVADLFAVARHEVDEAARFLPARYPDWHDAVGAAALALQEDLRLALARDPRLYGIEAHVTRTAGFVRVALRLAFWELAHAPGFEAGLVDVVNRGGDADTNGAIAGALLGARFGITGIPARWRRVVLDAPPVARLGAIAARCHPSTFFRSAQPPSAGDSLDAVPD